MSGGIYGQNSLTSRTITESQRDSIFNKITRGNEAIEKNKVLALRIIEKDSVIAIKTTIIGVQLNELSLKDEQISNYIKIVDNQKQIIKNEKKRGRRKGFYGFLKGAAIGAGAILLLTL